MRVLFYDIETAPNLALVWGQFEQNVIAHEREWYLLCFAYKWMGDSRTKSVALTDFPLYDKDPENDYEVALALWDLIDQADVVVAHNGDKFDMRKANARFVKHGMTPPSPVQQIDTLKIARRYFMFNSNSLGNLGEHLDLGSKEETGGFKLWKGCMQGHKPSWDKMKRYARQDVDLLEQVYYRLRPWAATHPAFNLIDNRTDACPKCGKEDSLVRRGTRKRNKTTEYTQYRCNNCGGYCRSRTANKTDPPKYVL